MQINKNKLEGNKTNFFLEGESPTLSEENAKYNIFQSKRQKESLLVKLPISFINGRRIESVASVKFLCVIFD